MTPDDPRHGTYAGVQAHNKIGLELCEPCREARFRYVKRMKRRLKSGVRNRVPLGDEAWNIIDHWGQTRLWQATGINRNMLCQLHKAGPEAIVIRATRQRILDAQPAFTTIGIQRRLRALVAIGYSAVELARRTGCHREALLDLLNERRTFVRHEFGLPIVALYEELEGTPAPASAAATRMRNRAERAGWYPPAQWDDPDTDPEPTKKRELQREAPLDDVAIERRIGGDKHVHLTRREKTEALRRWLERDLGSINEFERRAGITRAHRYKSALAQKEAA